MMNLSRPSQPFICPSSWQKLLLCTDGSPRSQGAIKASLALAQVCGHKVYVVNVLRVRAEVEAVAPDARAMLAREVSSYLETIKAASAKAGVSVETRVRYGRLPHATILEEAEVIQPDLIVMGRFGHAGLSQLFMGSTTAQVIGYSPFNVLVVPQNATMAFRTLLVASDGSPCSDAAWGKALALARETQAELYAISVARGEGEIVQAKEIMHRLISAANQQGMPVQGLVLKGMQPDDAIVQEALRYKVNIIIMGSHGRTGVKKLLMGSVTERVIGQATCPVLVIKKSHPESFLSG
jgi:nucleotide-binding universal stress UspA family protein